MNSISNFSQPKDSRGKLIEAGRELFSQKGYHAVSVREISVLAQVNASMISYYFKGKEGLLIAILEELTTKGAQQIEHYIDKFESQDGFEIRLKEFLNSMTHYYLSNSSLIKLFLEELEREKPEAERVFAETLYKTFSKLQSFLKMAQDSGYLKSKSTDGRILIFHVLSPFINLMRTEACSLKFYKASLKDIKFREELIEQVVSSLLTQKDDFLENNS